MGGFEPTPSYPIANNRISALPPHFFTPWTLFLVWYPSRFILETISVQHAKKSTRKDINTNTKQVCVSSAPSTLFCPLDPPPALLIFGGDGPPAGGHTFSDLKNLCTDSCRPSPRPPSPDGIPCVCIFGLHSKIIHGRFLYCRNEVVHLNPNDAQVVDTV